MIDPQKALDRAGEISAWHRDNRDVPSADARPAGTVMALCPDGRPVYRADGCLALGIGLHAWDAQCRIRDACAVQDGFNRLGEYLSAYRAFAEWCEKENRT